MRRRGIGKVGAASLIGFILGLFVTWVAISPADPFPQYQPLAYASATLLVGLTIVLGAFDLILRSTGRKGVLKGIGGGFLVGFAAGAALYGLLAFGLSHVL